MKGHRTRKRDTLVETGVKDILAAKEMEKKLLSGTLLTSGPSSNAAAAMAKAVVHRLSNSALSAPEHEVPRVSLFDVATAYLQDNNLQSVEDVADLPVQKDFLSAVGEVSNSLRTSRDMYLSAPGLIAQKQAQLRDAVEKAMRKIPVGELESQIEHFSFEDYQEYLRSIGSLDDEPNFHVFAEGNLQPILAVLRDEAIGLNRGYRKVARNINGFQFVEDVFEGDGGDLGDDFEVVHRITTRSKETQTELRVNDKSFLAEITRLSGEIVSLQAVLKGQQHRLNQWDMFRETVIKRMAGLMEESRGTQRAKEEELGRVITLLVHAVHQNEDLVNKLSVLVGQQQQGANAPADGVSILSELDLVRERKKIAQTFTAAITRTKRQRFVLEQRIEALEKQSLEHNESWAKRLAIVQTNLSMLHRGFLEGRVKDAVTACEDSIEDQTTGGFGGQDAVKALDALEENLPAEQRRTCSALTEMAFQRLDEITVFSAKTAVDLVRNGHKQLVLAEGISKAANCISRARGVVSDLVRGIAKCLGSELFAASVRLDEQRRQLDIEKEQQLNALRKEHDIEHRASSLHKSLRKGKDTVSTLDCGVQVTESVIAAAIQAALLAPTSPTTSDLKKGKKGTKKTVADSSLRLDRPFSPSESNLVATNSTLDLSATLPGGGLGPSSPTGAPAAAAAAVSAPPPVLPPKPGLMQETVTLEAKTATEVLGSGMVFLEELGTEIRNYAAHLGAPVPTRVNEIGYLVAVMRQLGNRAANESARHTNASSTDDAAASGAAATTPSASGKKAKGGKSGRSGGGGDGDDATEATAATPSSASKKSDGGTKKNQHDNPKDTPKKNGSTTRPATVNSPHEASSSSTAANASLADRPKSESSLKRVTVVDPKTKSSDEASPNHPKPSQAPSATTQPHAATSSHGSASSRPTPLRPSNSSDDASSSPALSSPTKTASAHSSFASRTSATSHPPSRNYTIIEELLTKANLQSTDLSALSPSEIAAKLYHATPGTPETDDPTLTSGRRGRGAELAKQQSAKEAALRAVADAAVARAEAEAAQAKEHAARLAAELAAAVAEAAAAKASAAEVLFSRDRLVSPSNAVRGGTTPTRATSPAAAAVDPKEVLDAKQISLRIAADREKTLEAGAARIGLQSRQLAAIARVPHGDTGMPRLQPITSPDASSQYRFAESPPPVAAKAGTTQFPQLANRGLVGRWKRPPDAARDVTPPQDTRSRAGSISPFSVQCDRLLGRATPPPSEATALPLTPLELGTRRYDVGTPSAAVKTSKLEARTPSRTPGPRAY